MHLLCSIVTHSCLEHPLWLHPLQVLHIALLSKDCPFKERGGRERGINVCKITYCLNANQLTCPLKSAVSCMFSFPYCHTSFRFSLGKGQFPLQTPTSVIKEKGSFAFQCAILWFQKWVLSTSLLPSWKRVTSVTLLNSKSSGFGQQRKDYYSRNQQILGSHQISQTWMNWRAGTEAAVDFKTQTASYNLFCLAVRNEREPKDKPLHKTPQMWNKFKLFNCSDDILEPPPLQKPHIVTYLSDLSSPELCTAVTLDPLLSYFSQQPPFLTDQTVACSISLKNDDPLLHLFRGGVILLYITKQLLKCSIQAYCANSGKPLCGDILLKGPEPKKL